MKLYIIHESYSDDDGNVGSNISGIYKTEVEAKEKLKELFEETLSYYNDPYSESEDNWFEISEKDDCMINNTGRITEVEVD